MVVPFAYIPLAYRLAIARTVPKLERGMALDFCMGNSATDC